MAENHRNVQDKEILSLVLLGVLLILGIGLYNLRAMGRAA